MQNRPHLRPWVHLALFFILLGSLFSPSFAVSPVQAAASPWLDAQQSAGIVYLLYAAPPVIKRYQTDTQTWLPDITLSATPTAFRVTTDGLYVGFGRRAARLQLDGSGETHLLNTSWDIIALHVANPILVLNCSSSLYANLITYNLTSQTIIDSKSYYPYAMIGSSLAPTIHKLFGRDAGLSPADIIQASFSPDGLLTGQSDSPYHGDYPSAYKTWVSPNDRVVIDDSGTMYNTADLTYRSSLGGHLDDLTFYGDLPIVLRSGVIIAYSNTYLETGRATPAYPPLNIFVAGETVYGFYSSGQGPQVVTIPLSTLNTQQPGMPVDPKGLAYTPDKTEIGGDETLYLLSKKYQSIFRWSLAQRRYLGTIPLLDVPYSFAYAQNENRLYTVYQNGSVYKIELDGDLMEKPFANLPSSPCGLATAGSYVFTCDNSGAWATHTVFSPAGQTLSAKDWNYYSAEYIWNAARQKMYFFRDDSSPNDLLWEDIDANGVLGTEKDSPYHGDFSFIHPIRVKPDGSVVLIGTGIMFDGLTMSQVNSLSNGISDAGWKGDSLVTLRSYNSASQLQQWTPGNYGIARAQAVSGSPLGMFSVSEGWLVVTSLSGRPYFTLWSPEFVSLINPPVANFTADPLAGGIPLEVHFTNLSSGSFASNLWSFGDGTTSADQNPVHLFTKSGTYTITLTVSGPDGEDTMTQTLPIEVQPVTAKFTPSAFSGQAPVTVQFTNQTIGQYNGALWDFGDGATSTEKNPSHTYRNVGSYTVTLTVSGPYGSSTLSQAKLIQVTKNAYFYLPMLHQRTPPLLKPGKYVFNNLCQKFPLYVQGMYIGQMRECVPSVVITTDGTMYFYYTWTLSQSPNASECVTKYSDAGNFNMYIKDSAGNRYDHVDVGGDQYIGCMESGVPYTGWFIFPPAQTKNIIFTFYDDDAGIAIGPIKLAAAP